MKFNLFCAQFDPLLVGTRPQICKNELEFEADSLDEVLPYIEQFLLGCGFSVPHGLAEGSLWWQEKESEDDLEC